MVVLVVVVSGSGVEELPCQRGSKGAGEGSERVPREVWVGASKAPAPLPCMLSVGGGDRKVSARRH